MFGEKLSQSEMKQKAKEAQVMAAEAEFNRLNRRVQELEEDLENTETKFVLGSQKLDKAATTADDDGHGGYDAQPLEVLLGPCAVLYRGGGGGVGPVPSPAQLQSCEFYYDMCYDPETFSFVAPPEALLAPTGPPLPPSPIRADDEAAADPLAGVSAASSLPVVTTSISRSASRAG